MPNNHSKIHHISPSYCPQYVSADSSFKWYALRVYASRETLVKSNIMKIIDGTKFESKIRDIKIPMISITDYNNGKIRSKLNVKYSGYIYLYADMNWELIEKVEKISNVFRFSGSKGKPEPISTSEMRSILSSEY